MAEAALRLPRPPGGTATARRRQRPSPVLRAPLPAPALPPEYRTAPLPCPALPCPARGAVRCGRPRVRR